MAGMAISVETSICETSEISRDQSAEASSFEISEVHLEFCSQLFEVCSQLFHVFASFQFVQGFDAFGSCFLHLPQSVSQRACVSQ